MEEEFYCVLKLVTGEEVFSLISIDEKNETIKMKEPVMISLVENQYGCLVKIRPWMELPNDEFYYIHSDKIITMTEVDDNKLILGYNKFISEKNNENTDGKKVSITNKMGYISSVKEARTKLESIYKDL